MIGRRAVAGLSLLCALMFCAFAAQSASAQTSNNTTAFTCVKGGGNLDFKDPHCDEKVTPGTGEYGHVEIKNNETTEITVDNSTTGGATSSAVLKSKAFGAAVEITCAKVHGTGTLHNTEPTSKQHTVTGTITVKYTECKVLKPLKCEVAEPIEVKAEFHGADKTGPNKDTHGVEFFPHVGTNFVEITFKNKGAELCALNGKTFPVKGSAVATGTPSPKDKHTGATSIFTDEMTTETLKFSEEKAGFDSITTVKRIGGNPIALTTTT